MTARTPLVVFRCWSPGCGEPTEVPSVYCAGHNRKAAEAWAASQQTGQHGDQADQDHQVVEAGAQWCRVCDEQPATADGLCSFCGADVAEGRVTDPDPVDGPEGGLSLPTRAELVPAGYCYACGLAAGDGLVSAVYAGVHRVPGECADRDVRPGDPARLVDREVLRVLQETLHLGRGQASGHAPVDLAPVMAQRILAAVADTVAVYTQAGCTDRGGAS